MPSKTTLAVRGNRKRKATIMSELYERMKARGIDMSWYEKNKKGKVDGSAVPIDDEECSSLSIYYLKEDGSLWTVASDGEPYKKVREGKKEQPKSIYLCAHCKQQWDTFLDVADKDMFLCHP